MPKKKPVSARQNRFKPFELSAGPEIVMRNRLQLYRS
jgi:hypothetical protein